MNTEQVMKIKAQFQVIELTETNYKQQKVKAVPYYGTGPENNDYSKWTPSGVFEFNVTDETHVFGNLKVNDFFIMDITVKREVKVEVPTV
jgi:hypothetical protein